MFAVLSMLCAPVARCFRFRSSHLPLQPQSAFSPERHGNQGHGKAYGGLGSGSGLEGDDIMLNADGEDVEGGYDHDHDHDHDHYEGDHHQGVFWCKPADGLLSVWQKGLHRFSIITVNPIINNHHHYNS